MPSTKHNAARSDAAVVPLCQPSPRRKALHRFWGLHVPTLGLTCRAGDAKTPARHLFSGSMVHPGIEVTRAPCVNSPKTGDCRSAPRAAECLGGGHHSSTSAVGETVATIPCRYIRRSGSAVGLGRTAQLSASPDVACRPKKSSPERPATTGDRCHLTVAGTTSQGDHAHSSALDQKAAHPVGSSSLGSSEHRRSRVLVRVSWRARYRCTSGCDAAAADSSSATVSMGRCLPRRVERTAGALSYIGGSLRDATRVSGPTLLPPPFFPRGRGCRHISHRASPMNDQAKCRGEHCGVREQCDRYTRPAGDRQTWLLIPAPAQNASCTLFVPVVEEVPK